MTQPIENDDRLTPCHILQQFIRPSGLDFALALALFVLTESLVYTQELLIATAKYV